MILATQIPAGYAHRRDFEKSVARYLPQRRQSRIRDDSHRPGPSRTSSGSEDPGKTPLVDVALTQELLDNLYCVGAQQVDAVVLDVPCVRVITVGEVLETLKGFVRTKGVGAEPSHAREFVIAAVQPVEDRLVPDVRLYVLDRLVGASARLFIWNASAV